MKKKRKSSLDIANLGEQYLFWEHFQWLASHYLVHWSVLVKITISSAPVPPMPEKAHPKTETLHVASFSFTPLVNLSLQPASEVGFGGHGSLT